MCSRADDCSKPRVEGLTDALRRINAERREKEAAVAAMHRALADVARERDRSRKNIVSRIQAEKRAAGLQEQVEYHELAAAEAARRHSEQVAEVEAGVTALRQQLSAVTAARDAAAATVEELHSTVATLQVRLQ